jgi:DNA invertase Pin-like site-specific DNA recombinase
MPLLNTREKRTLMEQFISDMILQIQSFFAQMERDSIRQRQEEGIKSAKARGIRFGRPKKKNRTNFPITDTAGRRKKYPCNKPFNKAGLKKARFTNF